MTDAVILYTAVEAKLAACANVLAPMTSIYRWQGVMEQASETPMLLKTTASAAGQLKDLILKSHPYDTPCVLALRVEADMSNSGFIRWLEEEIA